MTGKQREPIHEIDRLAIELIDSVAEHSGRPKPVEYSQLIIDVRDYIKKELDGMDDDELEYPF